MEKYVKFVWSILKKSTLEMQTEDSQLCLEEIVGKAYEEHGHQIYNGLYELISDHLRQNVRKELLQNLDKNFLLKMNEAWIEHHTSMEMLGDMLAHMDKENKEQRELDSVYNMGLKLFKYEITTSSDIKNALSKKMLDIVKEKHLGAEISICELKNVCTMLIKLDVPSFYYFEKMFENPYLLYLADFYEIQSEKLMKENPKDYDQNMKAYMSNEIEFALKFLHESSEDRIVQVFKEVIDRTKLLNNSIRNDASSPKTKHLRVDESKE